MLREKKKDGTRAIWVLINFFLMQLQPVDFTGACLSFKILKKVSKPRQNDNLGSQVRVCASESVYRRKNSFFLFFFPAIVLAPRPRSEVRDPSLCGRP
jgi:hypothetical protein